MSNKQLNNIQQILYPQVIACKGVTDTGQMHSDTENMNTLD